MFEAERKEIDNLYKKIIEITSDILKKSYGSLENVEFPINIRKIIQEHNITIFETYLNPLDNFFSINKEEGYLRPIYGDDGNVEKWRIYIDYEMSEFVKRYAMTEAFVHYYLKTECKYLELNARASCGSQLKSIKKTKKDPIVQMMVSFLLFPPCLVLKEIKKYIESERENRYNKDMLFFMNDLSLVAQVPTMNTIASMQYLWNVLDF